MFFLPDTSKPRISKKLLAIVNAEEERENAPRPRAPSPTADPPSHRQRRATRSILKKNTPGYIASQPLRLSTYTLPSPPPNARLLPRLDHHFLLWRIGMLKVMSEFLPDKPVKLYLDVTDFDEISEEDLKYRRLWRQWHTRMARMRQGLEPSVYSHYHDGHGVFGVRLSTAWLYASVPIMIGKYRHDVPIVAAACVFELMRKGLNRRGLFRPVRLELGQRIEELFEIYNCAPNFGETHSLENEPTDNVCELLMFYMKRFPEPLINMHIYYSLCDWCVAPSIHRDEPWIIKEHDRVNDAWMTGQLHPDLRPSTEKILHHRRGYPIYDLAEEGIQIGIAQALLRLMPTAHFSMLVFMLSFLSELGHTRGNGFGFDDIGRVFGMPLFGRNLRYAPKVLWWLASRWDDISIGLLGREEDLCERDAQLLHMCNMETPPSMRKWKWTPFERRVSIASKYS